MIESVFHEPQSATVEETSETPVDQTRSDDSPSDDQPDDLTDLLERIDDVADKGSQVTIGDILNGIGQHSFAPLLLVPGLVMVAPVIGDIPGIPTLMGLLVIVVSVQFIVGRKRFWIPRWIEDRKVSSSKVKKTLSWLRAPANFVDRWSKPRFTKLINHAGVSVIATVCIVIAMATPMMEVVPMSANVAGAAVTAFGVAILVRDGLLAMIAIACSLATMALTVNHLL